MGGDVWMMLGGRMNAGVGRKMNEQLTFAHAVIY